MEGIRRRRSRTPEDLYGKSKYLGEVTTGNALTLRTSIIGRELANFRSLLEWFLSQKGKSVRGFTAGHLLRSDDELHGGTGLQNHFRAPDPVRVCTRLPALRFPSTISCA